jgi:DNA-binding CsgD family transcriptional regulator
LPEREGELAELGRLLSDARQGRGWLCLVEGPAGIGKSRLLDEARGRAPEEGVTVLAARGGELECDFGFGIVRQLVEPTLARSSPAERAELFAAAAHLAEPVFAAEPSAGDGAGDRTHPTVHGLYWLVVNLSERAPLLLAIDDVHWADPPSLRFLLHLARRLDGLRVAIVLTIRTGEDAGQPELLRALALEARPPPLRPQPLSEAATGSLVAASLGEEVGRTLSQACHEVTGGNPFLLTELVDELGRQPHTDDEIGPAAVRGLASQRIAASVLRRVAHVDTQAPAFAPALAVLGAQASLSQVAGLAGLGLGEARRLAGLLAGVGVIDPAAPVRFVHPLVRASVYQDIALDERDSLHRRAARLLAEEGADAESVAVHLLASDPAAEPRTVETLRAAGRAALARASPETAVRCLRRALDEPPAADERPAVLLELGTAESLLVDATAASEHLQAARNALSGAEDRLAATRLLAGVLGMSQRADEAVAVFIQEMETHAGVDPELAGQAAAHAVNFGRMGPAAWRRARGAATQLRQRVAGGTEQDPAVLAAVAAEMVQAGDPVEPTAELAERALAALPAAEGWGLSDWSGHVATRTLVMADRFDLARRTLDAAIAGLSARGDPLFAAAAYAYRADLLYRLGELARAEEDALAGHTLSAEHGWPVGIPALVCRRVYSLLERGDPAAAATLVVESGLAGPASVLPDTYTFNLLLDARGRLRLAQDRPGEAVDDLLECGRRQDALGEVNPALVAWRSGAALALLRLGERERAAQLADDELERARAFGAPRALGVALRAAGLVEGGAAGLDLLADAVHTLERSPACLERARALVDWGSALRRAGRPRDARSQLTEGMDLAHRCGATALLDTAHRELVLAGARPRRFALTGVDALTPSELRVAEMAAEGMTNKDIAQALFVTLRTVEMHLSNAYRKLQIASRRELGRALAESSASP